MRLVIDCFTLTKAEGKSMNVYNVAKNIVENLSRDMDRTVSVGTSGTAYKNNIIVLGNKNNREDFDLPGIKFVCVKYNPNDKAICRMWEHSLVSLALRKLRPDRVLFPTGIAPVVNGIDSVVIVQDMIPFYYEEYYPGLLNKDGKYNMRRLLASIRSASSVITVSEYTKMNIIKYTGVAADKITVINNGINNEIEVDESKYGYAINPEDIRSIATLPEKPYISALGSILPHKNTEGLVRAYRAYYKLSQNPMDLVIIGVDNLKQFHIEPQIEKHITYFKYIVKDSDVYNVIKKSKVFLFPSKQEGFGLAPLEAMVLGVPVVCSDSSSLPEVVGDAALTVDCEDEVDIAQGLLCMEKEELRKDYIAKGLKNIKRFSWESKIQEYRKVLLR